MSIMKTHIKFFSVITALVLVSITFSCSQDKIDPALVLDEVMTPNGYHQTVNPPSDALARLEELSLENPKNHYYYLTRNDLNTSEWIFPQTELKIEYVAKSKITDVDSKTNVVGVVVKKIQGNYRDEKFIIAENRPLPKDGLGNFYEYISNNLSYPEEAKKAGVQGKVFIEFVVDEDGKLTEVKVIRGIGSGCDEEAIRVMKEAPNWTPGIIGGKTAKVKMILPISYKLS